MVGVGGRGVRGAEFQPGPEPVAENPDRAGGELFRHRLERPGAGPVHGELEYILLFRVIYGMRDCSRGQATPRTVRTAIKPRINPLWKMKKPTDCFRVRFFAKSKRSSNIGYSYPVFGLKNVGNTSFLALESCPSQLFFVTF